jgi:hypothetical protein
MVVMVVVIIDDWDCLACFDFHVRLTMLLLFPSL